MTGFHVLIPRGDVDEHKARWAPARVGGRVSARVSCPRCGRVSALVRSRDYGYAIQTDGTVVPRFACPNVRCDFHERLRLDRWVP